MDRVDAITRVATADDLAAVQRVAQITWRATYSQAIAKRDIDHFLNWAYGLDRLESHLSRYGDGFLVAELDGQVVGYAMAGLNHDRGPELYALYVLPEQHGDGIGLRLWNAALAQVDRLGETRMCCWVLESNVRARRFYERRGAIMTESQSFPIGASMVEEVRYCAAIGGKSEQAGSGSAACR